MSKMRFSVDPGKADAKELKGYHDVPEVRLQVVGPEGDHYECFWCGETFSSPKRLRFCLRCGHCLDCG